MKIWKILAPIAFLLPHSAEAETLTFYTSSTEAELRVFETVMQQLGTRMGLHFAISPAPAERALLDANAGRVDGDGLRVSGLEKTYPNLLRVPEKFMDAQFVAISRRPNINISGWDSLKPHRVGIVLGWKILEENVVGTKDLSKVANPENLFEMLLRDRFDIAIYTKADAIEIIRRMPGAGLHILEPPLASREMFLYLNAKHQDLVPKMAASLKRMKTDGSYRKLLQKIGAPLP